MAERRNYVALHLVTREVDQSLSDARQALEAYVANTSEIEHLENSLTAIHQVHGVLKMLEFNGAALLARAAELMARDLVNQSVENVNAGLQALMEALLQLPLYVQRVKSTGADQPGKLLPLVNELRAARGEKLLDEKALFVPRLQAAHVAKPKIPKANPDEFVALIKKMRQAFQSSMLSLIKGETLGNPGETIGKILQRLSSLSTDTASQPMWQIAEGVCAAVVSGGFSNEDLTKQALRHIDHELKLLADFGPTQLGKVPGDDVLRALLYPLALSTPATPLIAELQERYSLSSTQVLEVAAKDEFDIALPDADVLSAVVQALSEEMGLIKAVLEKYAREEAVSKEEWAAVGPVFDRVLSAMIVLGLVEPLEVFKAQYERLKPYIAGDAVEIQVLSEVAAEMVAVESALLQSRSLDEARHVRAISYALNQATETAVREARGALEHAKEAIAIFIEKEERDYDKLSNVPAMLGEVRGTLTLIGMPKASHVIASCQRYIAQNLVARHEEPSFELMNALADALTSVEYYLERMSEEHDEYVDLILEVGVDSVAQLGYPLDALEETLAAVRMQAGAEPADDAAEADMADEVVDEEAPEEAPAVDIEEAAEEDAAAVASEVIEAVEAPVAEEAADIESEPEPEVVEPETVGDVAPEAPAVEAVSAAAVDDGHVPRVAGDAAAASEEVDEEILEIFIEEAAEVLETINEFLPQWIASPSDSDALTELRRAYHTLKGSGRMVGAVDLGELAWSIESMLNRIIDGTVSFSEPRGAVVARVTKLVPGMVDAFKNSQVVDPDWLKQQIAYANALASGEEVPDMPVVAAPAAEPAAETVDELPASTEEAPAEAMEPEAEAAEAEEPVLEIEEVSLEPVAEDEGMSFDTADDEIVEPAEVPEAVEALSPEPEAAAEAPLAEPVDQELIDIFTGEAVGYMEALDTFVESALAADGPIQLSEDLRRALHTLKGSARMAEITHIAAIAVPLEKLVKEMLACQMLADSRDTEVLAEASEKMREGLDNLKKTGIDSIAGLDPFLEKLRILHEDKQALIAERGAEGLTSTPEFIASFLELGMEHLMDASETLERWREGEETGEILVRLRKELAILRDAAIRAELSTMVDLCVGLESIYETVGNRADAITDRFFQLAQEAQETLIDLMDFVAAGQALPEVDRLLADLRQYVADIQASAPEDADIEEITLEAPAEDAEEITLEALPEEEPAATGGSSLIEFVDDESVFEEVSEEAGEEDDYEATETAWAGADDGGIEESDETPAEDVAEEAPAEEPVATEAEEEVELAEEVDPEILEIFFEEASELLEEIDVSVNGWLGDRQNRQFVEELKRQLHTIKGSARLAGLKVLGDVSHDMETFIIGKEHSPKDWDDAFLETIQRYLDQLVSLTEAAQRGESLQAVDVAAEAPASEAVEEAPAEEEISAEQAAQDAAEAAAFEAPVADDADDEVPEEVDAEILEIFMEEANELIDAIDGSIHAWLAARTERGPLDELKRLLHTLKGGARLAGLRKLGDVSHDMETFIIGKEHSPKDWNDKFFESVQKFHDQLNAQMDKVRGGQAPAPAPKPAPTEAKATKPDAPTPAEPKAPVVDNVIPFVARNVNVGRVPPPPSRLQQAIAMQSQGAAAQEAVRVSAELLENLVNLAGETSISRARVEEQINEFGRSLNEMQATIERLVDQLRRLDMETQAQISFRQEQLEVEGREDFDPLEMDRYSMLQQLSRALFESSHDINDITDGLFDKTRDMETLVLQQSRINTELQEGLMQSQMVPFERMVPKLRRIVRQVSGELKKQVNFEVLNAEGEMDRTMLDRIGAPLEHMLRNAIDHGLEDAAARKKAGKNAAGTITLALTREGSEVVINLSDDGNGVNLAAVRKKAIERGLMDESAELSDHEIVQFIMSAGFSTADQVTQISGRGVGMDVVASEIKQLGGSIDIHTEPGKGTRFEIRLPFTMSVNRALMVAIGDDQYAIPLTSIEGIVRVSPYELEAYYQPDAPLFEYAGDSYHLRYLGNLLHTQERPNMEGFTMPLPVLLVRGSEHSVAIQVDRLLGSREIVVKTLGRQFGMVQGLSGATVLGDGDS